jgi:hypothetical protein
MGTITGVAGLLLAVPGAIVSTLGIKDRLDARRSPESRESPARPAHPAMLWVGVGLGLLGVALIASAGSGKGTPPHHPGTPPTTIPTPASGETVPELSDTALQAILVPKSEYAPLLPEYYEKVEEDENAVKFALQEGVPKLTLCNASIPATGLGPDAAAAYRGEPLGVRANIYFGSDAASFSTRQAAEAWMKQAEEEGTGCGWRALEGPQLDDQTVRLTKDQSGEEYEGRKADVVLVRAGGSVLEVGTETTKGSHSADASRLAEGAALRLARAVHRAGSQAGA